MQRFNKFSLLIIFIYFYPIVLLGHDDQDTNIDNLLHQVEEKKLAEHPYWHKLLHYRSTFFARHVKSDVLSKEYFLSPEGETNPQSELQATIKSFFAPPDKDLNNHAQCRFVSRFEWLKKVLSWDKIKITQYHCPKYDEWTQNHSVKSLSLVFATGYLGNPGSFFGHPFLKFNFMNSKNPNELLDESVTYGAFTPEQVNPFAYAFKGVLGGYKAGFIHLKFFYSDHNYTEMDLRDLWVYELKLTKDQIEQIVSHAWDLMDQKFPYYFLSDNCASRIAELLEMVIDHELVPKHALYSLPYVLFDHIFEAGMVKDFYLIPSRQTKLTHKYLSLDETGKKLVKKIIHDPATMDKEEFQARKTDEKIRVLETLFDYNSFRLTQNKENHKLKSFKTRLLEERLKLPSGQQTWAPINSPAPHTWQKPTLLQFNVFHSEKFNFGTTLRWRPAYYDLLALEMGQLPNGSLSAFDMEFSYAGEKAWINYIDIVAIQSLKLSQTGLPGDGGMAWNLKLGIDNQDLACQDCLSARVQGGLGKGFAFNRNFMIYGMFNSRLQSEVRNSGTLALVPELASLLTLSKAWKAQLIMERRYYLNGDKSKNPIYSLENRFGNSRTWDLRLSYKKHVDEQIKFGLTYYW